MIGDDTAIVDVDQVRNEGTWRVRYRLRRSSRGWAGQRHRTAPGNDRPSSLWDPGSIKTGFENLFLGPQRKQGPPLLALRGVEIVSNHGL